MLALGSFLWMYTFTLSNICTVCLQLVHFFRYDEKKVGQVVQVACVGSGNALTFTNQQVNLATCTSNSRLLLAVGGQELPYEELGCIKKNKEVLTEIGTCANGPGTAAIRAGWQVGTDLIGFTPIKVI